jgi:hypothetical protein
MKLSIRRVSALAATLLLSLPASRSTAPWNKSLTHDDQPQSALKGKANPPTAPPRLLSLDQKVDERILPVLFAHRGERGAYVQRFVGAAEGTRQPDGSLKPAYISHIDPGNFALNRGSFSFQNSPEKPVAHNAQEADLIQSEVLRIQALELVFQAKKRGIELSLVELASGIDLANQSPAAACVKQPDRRLIDLLAAGKDRAANTVLAASKFHENNCVWGYIDRLKQVKKTQSGIAAVVEARTWSYFQADPTQYRFNRWDAFGFGHSPTRIRNDQTRRTEQIVEALNEVLVAPDD